MRHWLVVALALVGLVTGAAALGVSLGGCAGQAGPSAVATDGSRPMWQTQMDEARRFTAAGKNVVLGGPGGEIVFYNRPRPFCYTYTIPGEWVAAREPNLYRSKDGRAFAGVLFRLPADFEGLEGATLVERARTLATREHEKTLGLSLTGVEMVPFDSPRPGTWKWTATPAVKGTYLIAVPTKIIVDLSPDAIVQITAAGTGDDDGLARRIIQTLKTTSDPECYWADLERMLRSTDGSR